MKKIIFGLMVMALTSCGPSQAEIELMQAAKGQSSNVTVLDNNGDKYSIIIIDECQYISGYDTFNNPLFSHKGNCNNPEHEVKE